MEDSYSIKFLVWASTCLKILSQTILTLSLNGINLKNIFFLLNHKILM